MNQARLRRPGHFIVSPGSICPSARRAGPRWSLARFGDLLRIWRGQISPCHTRGDGRHRQTEKDFCIGRELYLRAVNINLPGVTVFF